MLSLNLTLLGQMLTFVVFVWFTMRYVWPPITQAIRDRQEQLAEGLAAAEQSKRELELSKHQAAEMIRDAKIQATQIVENANKRGSQLIDEAIQKARKESERLIHLAKVEMDKEILKAQQDLKNQMVHVGIAVAEKILAKKIDAATQAEFIEKSITEI